MQSTYLRFQDPDLRGNQNTSPLHPCLDDFTQGVCIITDYRQIVHPCFETSTTEKPLSF